MASMALQYRNNLSTRRELEPTFKQANNQQAKCYLTQ